jgi:hypothetical protein
MRVRALLFAVLLAALAFAPAQTQSRAAVTSPRDAFGSAIGDDYFLATYSQLESYWKALDQSRIGCLWWTSGAPKKAARSGWPW